MSESAYMFEALSVPKKIALVFSGFLSADWTGSQSLSTLHTDLLSFSPPFSPIYVGTSVTLHTHVFFVELWIFDI